MNQMEAQIRSLSNTILVILKDTDLYHTTQIEELKSRHVTTTHIQHAYYTLPTLEDLRKRLKQRMEAPNVGYLGRNE